jgi:hypothetical protein
LSVTRLGLNLLSPGQADAHILYNRSLWILEALSVGVVESRLLAAPAAATDGMIYIPAVPATGVWTGKENRLMLWLKGSWIEMTPVVGMEFWSKDEAIAVRWDGTEWS